MKFVIALIGQKEHLYVPMKTVHEKRKDFECKICYKIFGFETQSLNLHMKTVHEKCPEKTLYVKFFVKLLH